MDANKVTLILLSLVALSGVGLALSANMKVVNAEWICIAQSCSEYATGDEWVSQNCKLEGEEMFCSFQYEEQNFRVPLKGINISNMVSCKTYTCETEVLVKKANG